MIAVARVHKALPAHGPETDFETQIQQQKKKKKNIGWTNFFQSADRKQTIF